MATPRRRSSRLKSPAAQSPSKATPVGKLSTLEEREETPERDTSARSNPVTSPSVTQTPKTSPPLKPSTEEMHPSLYHSANKKLAAAQRFGFSEKPGNKDKGEIGSPPTISTPVKQTSKSAIPTAPKTEPIKKSSSADANANADATFAFTFRHPSTELSSEAQRIMDSVRGEAERIRMQLAAHRDEQVEKDGNAEALFGGRKIAMPKGKLGRFSDVHVQQFKKMESIANHPSAYRAAAKAPAETLGAEKKSLKRTNSKAELDKSEETPKSLKRTNSKASISEATKSTKSSNGTAVNTTDKPTYESTKRRKTMFESKEAMNEASSLTTPTKSVPATDTQPQGNNSTSKIPALSRTPSTKSMRQPSTPVKTPTTTIPTVPATAPPARATFASRLANVKSILRRPQLKFSNDPRKQAAGTHVSPSKGTVADDTEVSTPVNRTEKHVNFTPEPPRVFDRTPDASLSEHAVAMEQEQPSPSPVKANASDTAKSSEATPERPISYPSLALMSAPPKQTPAMGDFTFRASSASLSFAPSPPKLGPRTSSIQDAPSPPKTGIFKSPNKPGPSPTIRKVRPSVTPFNGIEHGLANKKRKRANDDTGDGGEDDVGKENTAPQSDSVCATQKDDVKLPATPAKRVKLSAPARAPATAPVKRVTLTPSRPKMPGRFTGAKRFVTPTKRVEPTRSPSVAISSPGSERKVKSISWSRLNALATPKKRA